MIRNFAKGWAPREDVGMRNLAKIVFTVTVSVGTAYYLAQWSKDSAAPECTTERTSFDAAGNGYCTDAPQYAAPKTASR